MSSSWKQPETLNSTQDARCQILTVWLCTQSAVCSILISVPRLRIYYFLSLTLSLRLSLRLSVCHAAPSNRFFFFVSRWNRAMFLPSSLHVALYKTLFFDFRFRPPNAQNLLPQIACDNATLPHRHPWLRTWQFSSCLEKSAIQWIMGPTLVAMATKIWPRRGDLNAYRLVLFHCGLEL